LGLFSVEVVEIDLELKNNIENELRMKSSNDSLRSKANLNVPPLPARPGLPPPSTDELKWWENTKVKESPFNGLNLANPFKGMTTLHSSSTSNSKEKVWEAPTNLMD
jgi:hypothetical protein